MARKSPRRHRQGDWGCGMSNLRQAAQSFVDCWDSGNFFTDRHAERIRALRAALAEPEQDPVAEIQTEDMGKPFNAIRVTAHFYAEVPAVGTKLYKAPPKRDLTCVCGAVWEDETMVHPPRKREWVGLTHPQIHELDWPDGVSFEDILLFVRAIEQALKEKNT